MIAMTIRALADARSSVNPSKTAAGSSGKDGGKKTREDFFFFHFFHLSFSLSRPLNPHSLSKSPRPTTTLQMMPPTRMPRLLTPAVTPTARSIPR